MTANSTKTSSLWRAQQIRAGRSAVIEELDQVLLREGVAGRLARGMQQIAKLQEQTDAAAQLQRFLYIIAVLAHHARWGGLNEKQCRQLVQIGEAILIAQGVEPTTSSLSFVWGELHLTESQILRGAGSTWQSLWQQHMSQLQSRRSPASHPPFQALVIANRSLRMGHLEVARSAFDVARSGPLSLRNKEQADLGRIACLRLQGATEEAAAAAKESLRGLPSDNARLDFEWELICCNASATRDLQEMVASVDRSGMFRRGPYLIEAFLWTRAVQSRVYEDRVPHMRNLRRITGVQLDETPPMQGFHQCALQIEQCNESERPLHQRLEHLGSLLEEANRLPSIDKELLFLAAATRWLIRAKQKGFAATVLSEYRAKCRQLSAGQNDDVLGVLVDIDMDRTILGMMEQELKAS